MAKKKLKTKKPTVESKLRDQVEHLTKSVQEANTRYHNLDQDFLKIARSVRNLFSLARSIKGTSLQHEINRDMPYGRVRNTEELDAFEMLESIKMSFFKLAEDFAREDEGTALMQEHKEDLMIIIRGMIDDNTRPNDRQERLAGIIHNLEIAKRNGYTVNPDRPERPKN